MGTALRARARHTWDRIAGAWWFDASRRVWTGSGGGVGNGNMPAFTRDVRWAHSVLQELIPVGRWSWYQFVDVGCGRGKVLLAWSEENTRSLRRQDVHGVEFDAALAAAAARNVARRGVAASVECGDGRVYGFRPDERVIVWFFNSFGADDMQPMLDRLEACHEVWFVYGNPLHALMMLERGWRMQRLRVGPHERSTLALLHWVA